MMSEPTVGAIGLTQIHGGLGVMIRLGQWLAGGGFANYQHVVVAVMVSVDGRALVVEAEPGGARFGAYGPTDGILWSDFGLAGYQKQAVARAAMSYVDTPYSFLDYLALALHKFHIPAPYLKRYISSTKHQICSQLADQCYQDAGIHLFKDHRWPGYVMPLDLLEVVQKGLPA